MTRQHCACAIKAAALAAAHAGFVWCLLQTEDASAGVEWSSESHFRVCHACEWLAHVFVWALDVPRCA